MPKVNVKLNKWHIIMHIGIHGDYMICL